jgi:segregation and condensation protein B
VEEGDEAMASLAEKRIVVVEDHHVEEAAPEALPQARPEELRLLEALLFASPEPLETSALAKKMPEGVDVKAALLQLQADYEMRGVNLVRVASKWTFRTAGDLAWLMTRESTETRRLSRAAIEMLAIIAYHQPVTRAEIEQVRGVGLSKGTLDLLFEQNWIKPMGRRRAPGKPVTWGTTDFFLEHFGLPSLDDLPGQEELKAAGLLDARSQPPIFRPDEPDLPLEPTEDEADEPLAVEESPAESGR